MTTDSFPEWILKVAVSLLMLAFSVAGICGAIFIVVELVRYLK